jgi:hypothetical protein
MATSRSISSSGMELVSQEQCRHQRLGSWHFRSGILSGRR